jgi:F-type H+-transporting ATPase subunit b
MLWLVATPAGISATPAGISATPAEAGAAAITPAAPTAAVPSNEAAVAVPTTGVPTDEAAVTAPTAGVPSNEAAVTTPTAPPAAREPARAPQDPAHPEEAHAEEEEHAESPWWEMPARWVNFTLLMALLWWVLVVPPAAVRDIFTFPGLKVILSERAAAVLAARDLAARQRREAEQVLTESELRLSKIEDEVAALVAAARSDAEREKVRALEDGKVQAEKIVEVAGREVKNERLAAHRQLRGFVADLAVNMARRSIERHLTPEDQDRLIRDYLARLGESMA